MQSIKGYQLPFKQITIQTLIPKQPSLSVLECDLITQTIDKLLVSGAVVKSHEESGQFISNVFTVPKPDGSRRPIINLKHLNEYLDCPHFKMESIKTGSSLVCTGAFMCVIDLKDAYHSIPVAMEHQKFLKFNWRGSLYKYTCVPFGLCTASLLYTKLLKPVVAYFRINGILCVCYLDDLLVIAPSAELCKEQVKRIIEFLSKLGFIVNLEKSQLVPSQNIRYLGFVIDSVSMKLLLPSDKVDRLIGKCKAILKSDNNTIQKVSELEGTLVSACPATRYGLLYTRDLEIEKTQALQKSFGDYRTKMVLSLESKSDIQWWINNLETEWQFLLKTHPTYYLSSDASPSGWGSYCEDRVAKGHWDKDRMDLHINVLEIWAAFYAIKTFVDENNAHVLIRVDSSTAMAYINRFGGCRSRQCHSVAKILWQWCESKSLTVTATWINTKENYIADSLSRAEKDSSDFMLGSNYFLTLSKKFGSPNIDLFATYQSKQCEKFYSWKPDPFSVGVDAFTYIWQDNFYAFPPLNMVGRVINKITHDKCQRIVVAPYWPTQAWFPLFTKLLISEIVIFRPNKNLLFDPYSSQPHQVNTKLKLMAGVLSGKH